MEKNIWYATGELPELSNLAERYFRGEDGRLYNCVEHAYQTWKSGSFDQRVYDAYVAAGPGRKIVGRKGTRTKDDWNIRLMHRIIRKSILDNPPIQKKLLDTGHSILTHRQDRGIWKEQFPRLLMLVRRELRRTIAEYGLDIEKMDWSPRELVG